MTPKGTHFLTHLLTLLGLALVMTGGLMWWQQSRLEAALLSQSERVLLSVSSVPVAPQLLPESPERVIAQPTVTAATTPLLVEVPEGAPRPTQTPRPSPTLSPTPDLFPPAVEFPTRLMAPAIGLDTTVVQMGWEVKYDDAGNAYSEWLVPYSAAGWHQNSALPGHDSNTVLSGHHNVHGEVFRYIVDLEPGQEVMLEAGGVTYLYVVQEKYIVKEKGEPMEVRLENNRYIEPTPDERLTLISCWPYETNTHRVVVIARPVEPIADAP